MCARWASSYSVVMQQPLRTSATSDIPSAYTPFDRDAQQQEMGTLMAGDYHIEPGVFSLSPYGSQSTVSTQEY